MSEANAVTIREPENPMALMQIAIERGTDPDQLEKLMGLQERWERNQAAKAFGQAMADFQSQCPAITKTRGVNLTGGKRNDYLYASLDDIMRKIQPVLSSVGLSVSFSAAMTEGGQLSAVCRVRCGTHVEETSITLPVPSQMRVNDTQKMGAAMSYAKRYALTAALNIVVTDEDTDAGGMMETITEAQRIQLDDMLSGLSEERRPRFLAVYGVDSLANLPASRYAEARSALDRALVKAGNR